MLIDGKVPDSARVTVDALGELIPDAHLLTVLEARPLAAFRHRARFRRIDAAHLAHPRKRLAVVVGKQVVGGYCRDVLGVILGNLAHFARTVFRHDLRTGQVAPALRLFVGGTPLAGVALVLFKLASQGKQLFPHGSPPKLGGHCVWSDSPPSDRWLCV